MNAVENYTNFLMETQRDRYLGDLDSGILGYEKSGKENNKGENKYLFTIGRSVITSVVISHDPDGVVGFHEDGSPVHSKLTVTFRETTYVTSTDEVSKEDQALAKELQASDRTQAIQARMDSEGKGARPGPHG